MHVYEHMKRAHKLQVCSNWVDISVLMVSRTILHNYHGILTNALAGP